jgi:low temperature requirement protein LtrA
VGKSIVSPDGQSATFVELFFDLVFVFAITQMVGLLHHDLTWVGAGKAVLVFWMVWWGWTQFTWALNSADTTNPFVEAGTLLATAVAFFMAVTVPDAFGEGSMWFAGTYVGVRIVGLALYGLVGAHNPKLRGPLRNFTALSAGGLASALLGGFLGGTAQIWLWGLTILLDFVAATVAGESDWWSLHAEHFAERHGLIVIIALGESLIVAAAGVSGTGFGDGVLGVSVLAVLMSCALWWTYFPIAMPQMERGMASLTGFDQTRLARDTYSFGHFPMLAGVIAYSVALEEALAHPLQPLPDAGRLAMALGLVLFLGGTGFGMWRSTGHGPVPRLVVATGAAVGVYFVDGVMPMVTLSIALAGVAAIAAMDEQRAQRIKAAV